MATYHSAAELAKAQRARAKKVQRSLQIASKDMVEDMKAEALRLVSGDVSEETLRRLGHPFGRRRTNSRRRGAIRGTLPRLPINVQSGQLRKSLRVFRQASAQGISWRLQFTSPHAIVLSPGGTSKMAARGFWAALNKFYHGKAKRRLLVAWRLAHK